MSNSNSAPENNPSRAPDTDLHQVSRTESTVDRPSEGHPAAFYYFFWGEFAERCSFYGMRAILPLYLTKELHYSGSVYFWFKTACYALPLLGGFLADRYFGKYRTIVAFSIPYVLGHFILGIPETATVLIALILLACGSGVIKPNISTLMGETYDQQRPGQVQLRSAAFMWFYFAINVGALISNLACPFFRDHRGYAFAFQFPAWLMVISLGVFATGKRHYAVETLSRQPSSPTQRSEQLAAIGKLFGIFGLITLFWIPYEHMDSIWVYFADNYIDLNLPFLKYPVPPDMLQFINPLCVIIFAPLFAWLFPKLDPAGRVFTDRFKIFLGLAIGTVSSGIMAIGGSIATTEARISLGWLVISYVLLTIGEVLVYGTGLDLAFSAAPARMKGFVTGCFLLTNTLANFFNGFWVKLYGGVIGKDSPPDYALSPGTFFAVSGLFSLAATLLMLMMIFGQSKPLEAAEA